VTVDEAASIVGISRATFFRYFATKDDVVVSAVEASIPNYRTAFDAIEPGEYSAWQLARIAIEPVIVDADSQSQQRRARMRLVTSRTSLRMKFSERRRLQVHELADALAVTDAAWYEWAESDGPKLRALIDDAFQQLATGATIYHVG